MAERGRKTTEVEITQEIEAMRINNPKPEVSQSAYQIVNGDRPAGKGSFGVVFQAIEVETKKIVAIKRVLQDPRYKNRELQIMKMLDHPNCVKLLANFTEQSKGQVFLNLVLAFVPKNLYQVCDGYQQAKQKMPHLHIKLYVFQLCRSLAYIHSLGVCHRDIKPQNLLINPETLELKLCDFGSAKMLVQGEPNVSYICSRYYRAPELIFGASDYSNAIDVWSSGCVMAELMLGKPIFAGESNIDQLVEILKVLGTPTKEQIYLMSPDYKDHKQFPSIRPCPWEKVFSPNTPSLMIDLVSKMLVYPPKQRLLPLHICAHTLFDDLRTSREENLPPLFDFTETEKSQARAAGLLEKILPLGRR